MARTHPRKHGSTARAVLPLSGIEPKRFGPLTLRDFPLCPEALGVSALHVTLRAHSDTPCLVHKHTNEFTFVLRGRVDVFMDGRRYSLKGKDMLLIPAGAAHRIKTGEHSVEVLALFSPIVDMARPDAAPATRHGVGRRYKDPFVGKGDSN